MDRCSNSAGSVFHSLDAAKAEIWQDHPEWSEQQRQQSWEQLKIEFARYMCDDSITSDFALPVIPAAHESRPTKRRALSTAGSVNMRRSSSSGRRFTSAPSTSVRRQDRSQPYPAPTATVSAMATVADSPAASRPLFESDVFASGTSASMLDPDVYLARGGADMLPSPSMDGSSIITPYPSTLSEAMSRQTSCTSSSAVGGLSMLRIGSGYSMGMPELPVVIEQDGTEASFLSCAARASADSAQQLLGNVGSSFNGMQDLPSVSLAPFHGVFGDAGISNPLSFETEMLRSVSNRSNVSTSAVSSSERRRKHLENGRKPIAAKSVPSGPTSETARRRPTPLRRPHRQIKPADPTARTKAAITRAPCKRPPRPRVYCGKCNDKPKGFRGEHELKRHCDRAHPDGPQEVFINIDPGKPSVPEDWRPTRLIADCKTCVTQKPYHTDYNAAAHLRRNHFTPRKRGRRAKGEVREPRAGKGGGEWPDMDWFRGNGWIKRAVIGGGVAIPVDAVDGGFVDADDTEAVHFLADEAAKLPVAAGDEGRLGVGPEDGDCDDGEGDDDYGLPPYNGLGFCHDQHAMRTLGFDVPMTMADDYNGIDLAIGLQPGGFPEWQLPQASGSSVFGGVEVGAFAYYGS